MTMTCGKCGKVYDDAESWTICPHDSLKPGDMMGQWQMGRELIGKDVHFLHQTPAEAHHVNALKYDGSVGLEKLPGWFSPHLFKLIEGQEAKNV